MIYKERDPKEHPESDKFAKSGAKAEEQMAFYLRRAFGENPDVRVFHDLRFVDSNGEVVQIDHLVLHNYGLILIESKSVTSEVIINKNHEWARMWNGRKSGMASPILQTQRQADLLGKLLESCREQLLRKMMGLFQTRFGNCPFDVLVGISDTGVVTRDGAEPPEVCKADQIVERVKKIIEKRREENSPLNLSLKEGWLKLKDEEMENLTQFFLKYHYPRSVEQRAAVVPLGMAIPEAVGDAPQGCAETISEYSNDAQNVAVAGIGICPKCGIQAALLWGKFSYYWKCPTCQENMPIKEFCFTCHQKMKLRKDKNRYFKRCETCLTEALYYENRSV